MDEELENLKKRRLQELQQQAAMQQDVDAQERQNEEFEKQKKMVLIKILTPEARERLGRIKTARPELVENIETQLIMAAQSGQLKNKINDEQLRILLSKAIPRKRDIKIKRR